MPYAVFVVRDGETLHRLCGTDVKTGEVHGKTASRHTSADFVAFLHELVRKTPDSKDIHIILDNLSAHKTQTVRDFLEENPRVRFHFTPTYSSWLRDPSVAHSGSSASLVDK